MLLKLINYLGLMVVSFSIDAACSVIPCTCTTTGTGVAFGAYDATNAGNTDQTGSVNVSCSVTLGSQVTFSYVIALSTGSGSYAQRTMLQGAGVLNYNLYTTAGRTVVWGNGTGSSTVSDSFTTAFLSNSGNKNTTIYGRIPPNQYSVPASLSNYSDSITITVTY